MKGCLIVLLGWFAGALAAWAAPKVVVIASGEERSHRCAMVRYLLYTNGWETAALLHEGEGAWLEQQLALYDGVDDNLRLHDRAFPEATKLKEVMAPASVERVVALLLEEREAPLQLLLWSGVELLQRALSEIETHHGERKDWVAQWTQVHGVGAHDFLSLAQRWPQLTILVSREQAACLGLNWRERMSGRVRPYFEAPWMEKHILQGHGRLCAHYEVTKEGESLGQPGDFAEEDVAVTFLRLVPNGLGGEKSPGFGSWGGRFEPTPGAPNLWREAKDEGEVGKPLLRWLTHIQGDWQVRADWCVRSYEQANHGPTPVVNGSATRSVLGVTARPGQEITLDAGATTDPEGQRVVKAWWHYQDAGNSTAAIVMDPALSDRVTFTIPEATEAQTHHVMLTVRDGGTPGVFAYRRVLIRVPESEEVEPSP